MKITRTLQINSIDSALLSAVPPIDALPRAVRVPLSFTQQQLWSLSRRAGNKQGLHIQMGLRLRGELKEVALQSALDGLVARHEVLRTTFGLDHGEPFQRIGSAEAGLTLKQDDLTAADVKTTLADLMSPEAQATFDLDAGPLIRGRFVRLAAEDHVLLITMPTMISDDQSRNILTREFSELYAAARSERPSRLTPLTVQYADYAVWQRRWLPGAASERQPEYWGRRLAKAPTVLSTDRTRPARQDYTSRYVEFVLQEPLTTQLMAQSRRVGTTMFVPLLAGWVPVLARLSGQNEVNIDTLSANRTRSEIAGPLGPFASILTLRIDLSADPTLEALLEQVSVAALGAQAYQDLPFEQQLIERADPPSMQAHTAIFQAIPASQNNAAAPAVLPGLKLEYVGVGERVAKSDLALEFAKVEEVIRGRLFFTTLQFDRSTVELFASYLQLALSQMAVNVGRQVWSVPLLLEKEGNSLSAESKPREATFPQDRCIDEPLEAERNSNSVDCEDQSLSDRELNARTISAATCVCPLQSSPTNSNSPPRTAAMNFIEGTRDVTEDELLANSFTRYHVTKFYREQITESGYYDQLRYIVEPSFEEFESRGNLDTSGEHDNTVVPGFQHKYAQTGLLLVTDRCASYCRYCFRKRMVGKSSDEIATDFSRIAQYVIGHPEMTNVLLSGGDPFVLSTARLDKILDYLLPIPHLNSIRLGTKILAYEPKRLEDPALLALFQRIHEAGKSAVIVTHFDHIGEISADAERNILSLRAHGVQFLNQSVLLAKVNDNPEILAATFAKCHQMGVRPYYLFQGRPVKGASHFQVSLRRGLEIANGINQRLSGIQKTFKYIMSHYTGKIEVLDLGADGRVYMRYHQNKSPEKIGKIFSRPHLEGACWLDDLPEG
ncbi:condensation domain-containing protein [Rhizobium mongolense]|uniref:condensation domain-containing protein n=1 Tax=Rhizobium mongolense TaxID=57676 RepID=UPI0034A44034